MSFQVSDAWVNALLRGTREDTVEMISHYETRDLGECEIFFTYATLAFNQAEDRLLAGVRNETSGLTTFVLDPIPKYQEVHAHLAALEGCLRDNPPADDEPPSGGGGESPVDGDEDDLPALTFQPIPWRVGAGVVLLGLAAWGLWRMR